MRLRPELALVGAACVIAASTFALPSVTGYGTVLYQFVVLSAWAILAHLTSGAYADSHHLIFWIIVGVINLLYFLAPVAVIWLSARKRWPVFVAVATCIWCGFYLLCLFRLFPATDGP